jgi:hypothetical protein
MDSRRDVLVLALVGLACTKSNPAFDANDAGETRAADDGKDDTASAVDDAPDSDASDVDATDTAPGTSTTTDGGTTFDIVDSSGDPAECPEMTDFDWTIELFQSGSLLKVPCEAPFVLQGDVVAAEEGFVSIAACDGCGCSTTTEPIEVHSPELLLPVVFGNDSCARIEIEWSELADCRPVGFTASSDATGELAPVILGGQDVKELPQAVGAAELGFETTTVCQCEECCAQTGLATLGFFGVQIPEQGDGDVPDFLGDNVSWHVEVFEAHVHEDCTPALSWRAISNNL